MNNQKETKPEFGADPQGRLEALVRCDQCRYWDTSAYKKHVMGDCHRFPPTALESEDEDGKTDFVHVWPCTRFNDWCGEFART